MLCFGGELEFGLPPTAAALDAYLELLEPSGLPWSVAVMGGDVVACGTAERAIRRDGHVRVGLEDWSGPVRRATRSSCARPWSWSNGWAGTSRRSRRPRILGVPGRSRTLSTELHERLR
jgi:hypothetical protein